MPNLLLTEASEYLTTEDGDRLILEPIALGWNICIDWDNDGHYTDESDRLESISVLRGRNEVVAADGFTRADPGTCSLSLDNHDGRYDPYNASGELFGYILPNRAMYIDAVYSGMLERVFTGTVKDIRPQNSEYSKSVRIECMDGLEKLQSQLCDNAAIQSAYKVSDAVALLIGSIFASTDIEDNLDTIPYFWTNPDITVWNAINSLSQAFYGEFFVDVDGKFVYNARSTETTATLSLDQSEMLKDIQMIQPWDEIKNDIRITGSPRNKTGTVTLWALGDKPAIAAGASITVWAAFAQEGSPCPAFSVIDPVDDPDWDADTQLDGLGTDMSGSVTVVPTHYSTESKLVISNTHATDSLYLLTMQIRGVALEALDAFSSVAQSDTSITAYGKQSLMISSDWIQDAEWAQYYATLIKQYFSGIRRTMYVRVYERYEKQFCVDLFDLVNLTVDKWSVAGLYILAQITHEWQAGVGCITTFRLEPHPSEIITGAQFYFPGIWGELLVY